MNLVVLLFSFFSTLTPATLLSNNAQDRISGEASVVPEGKFPFVVSVTLNDVHICGGFIYNYRFIVTAASCVFEKTPAQIQITVGQLSFSLPDPGEQRFQIRNIITHENYDNDTMFNDIALLETSQDIVFGPNVNFSYYNQWTQPVFFADVMGWGATDESNVVSTKLRSALVFPPVNCDAFVSMDAVYDPNIMFCWGEPIQDSFRKPCIYDQGSPLYQQTGPTTGNVVGIVSKNLGCGDSEIYETIYTRLSAYYGWLTRNGGPQP